MKKPDTSNAAAKNKANAASAAAKAKAAAAKAKAKQQAEAAKAKNAAKKAAEPKKNGEKGVVKKLEDSCLKKQVEQLSKAAEEGSQAIIQSAKQQVAKSQELHDRGIKACVAANNAAKGCASMTKPECSQAASGNIEKAQGFLSTVTPESKDEIAKAMTKAIMAGKETAERTNADLAKAIENAKTK